MNRLCDALLTELIADAQADESNDSPAMNEIIRRFNPLARSIAAKVTWRSEVRPDLANAALLALTRAVRQHTPGRAGFAAYANLYMRGGALRELRQLGKWEAAAVARGHSFLSLEQVSEDDEPSLMTQDLVTTTPWGDGDLAHMVARLAPTQVRLLHRRHVDDASLATMARETGTTASAVSQRLRTVHRVLQRALQ